MKKIIITAHGMMFLAVSVLLFIFLSLPGIPEANSRYVTAEVFTQWIIFSASLGIIIFAGIGHFIFFFFQYKEKEYLYVAITCFFAVARFLSEEGSFIYIFTGHERKESAELLTWLFILGQGAILLFYIEIIRSKRIMENNAYIIYIPSLVLYLMSGLFFKFLVPDMFYMPGIPVNIFMMLCQVYLMLRNYLFAQKKIVETNDNLEKLVEMRTEELVAAQRAIRDMLISVSHDLKTPLTAISSNLEILVDGMATPGTPEYTRRLDTAYQKTGDLKRLIKNLFEVTRITSGTINYKSEWRLLSLLFSDIEEHYEGMMFTSKINFTTDIKTEAEIFISSERIWSVLDNLVYNAQRATPEGGSISITAGEVTDGFITLTIADTGCGMSSAQTEKIFTEGRGVGLKLAYAAVESMGGRISVESVENSGTKFNFTLKARSL